ncbi:MAG: NRDE family protein [Proteobacteria bacterium]|nr:NRDE family protein [Pseudomonadota bacterium]
MCIVLFALKAHPEHSLILIANRDEFLDRATAPAGPWPGAPGVIAGRDVQGGGTWMGMTRGGRVAMLTNFRDPASMRANAASRGILVQDFLLGDQDPRAYLEKVATRAVEFNGFNLLVGDLSRLFWFSDRGPGIVEVPPGVHGLSNALLDTPWPKVTRGKAALARLLEGNGPVREQDLHRILSDPEQAPDHALPATGVPLEWERALSSILVTLPGYGTRSSTILLAGPGSGVVYEERTRTPLSPGQAPPSQPARFSFTVEKEAF